MNQSNPNSKFEWPFREEYDHKIAYNLIHTVAERDLKEWEENSKYNGEVYPQLAIGEDGQFITKNSDPYNAGPRPHMPIEVLAVTKVTYSSANNKTVIAQVLCDDDIKRNCTYSCYYYPASWVDQEELEEKLIWETE